MRTRNREVNIFNMSLLDILTGMLGAFLFLMLGLVPYYTKTSKAKPETAAAAPTAPPGSQNLKVFTLQVTGHWFSPTQVGIYLYGNNHESSGANGGNIWRSYVPSNPILQRSGAITINGTSRGTGWQGASAGVQPKDRYLVAFEVPTGGAAGPPKGYARLGFTIELLKTEETPGGKSGDTRYVPTMDSFVANASRAEPGKVYGAFWITLTEDPSKIWYEQDNYEVEWAGSSSLPQGILPLPGIDDVLPPENETQQAGIGISVSSDAQSNTNSNQISDHLLVKGVFEGGPAAKAGLRVGDEITQINGLSVAGKKFDEVVRDWLQGKAGSPVQISVRRAGEQSPVSFVVERAPLKVPANH